jgi:peptidoglycan hydrolase-like protein with peptidoglycan-binding domain
MLAAFGAALVVAPAGLATAEASAATAGAGAVRVKAVNWPVVRQGATGERVRVIQGLLTQRGIREPVDGVFGKDTQASVKAFQRANKLAVDGQVGAATWQKLVVTLARGSKARSAVVALQHQLRFQYGYKSVAVDGAFGAATQAAVKSFQGKRGLRADGIAGLATWKELEA